MESGKKGMFFMDLCIALAGLWLDQFTKGLAVAHLKGQPPIVLIPGMLELRYLENRGAAFGFLQNQKAFFVVMTCLVLAFLLYALLRMPSSLQYRIFHIMGGILIAGALGNFLDRLRFDYVVDFIYIRLIDFPIFNVADMYISFICVLGLILVFFGHMDEVDFSFLRPSVGRSKTGESK